MTRSPDCTCRYDYTVRRVTSNGLGGVPAGVLPRAFITDAVRAYPDDTCPTHGNPAPLLTEAAGPARCRDCGTWIERGDPCVDMRDGTGDVTCATCGDEMGVI